MEDRILRLVTTVGIERVTRTELVGKTGLTALSWSCRDKSRCNGRGPSSQRFAPHFVARQRLWDRWSGHLVSFSSVGFGCPVFRKKFAPGSPTRSPHSIPAWVLRQTNACCSFKAPRPVLLQLPPKHGALW